MNKISKAVFPLFVLGVVLSLGGCKSDEENPVTPEKLKQIESSGDRGNFNPSMTPSPGGTTSGSGASGGAPTSGQR